LSGIARGSLLLFIKSVRTQVGAISCTVTEVLRNMKRWESV
jgi:hypothetical protein